MKNWIVLSVCLSLGFVVNSQVWLLDEVKQLPETVNQLSAEESSPIFSADGKRLYFVRSFSDANKGGASDQDVWFSDLSGGSYSEAQLAKEFNNKFNNSVVGFNKAGDVIYLLNTYDGKSDLVKGISKASFNGSSWSKPEKIEIPTLDIEGDFYGFYVSEDEKAMIISYAGPNSLGEEDLYVSLNEGGSWTKPEHLGSKINSSGFEISPFLSPSKDTLFFSSNGFGGEGDADIFFSVRNGSWTNWSAPKNLGSKINSPKFDAYFIRKGDQLYWSSNRGSEKSNIYSSGILPPPPIAATCVKMDITEHGRKDGAIDLMIEGGVAPYTYAWSNGQKKEDLSQLAAGIYTVQVTDAVGQVATAQAEITEPDLVLPPVVAIDYNRLVFVHYFGYNQNKLKVDRGDLRDFVKDAEKQLKEGRDRMTMVIVASASNVPTVSFESNQKLAEARANNLKYDLIKYFTRKGLVDRITVVVKEAQVQGPDYADDAQEKGKYEPFQFVEMVTE